MTDTGVAFRSGAHRTVFGGYQKTSVGMALAICILAIALLSPWLAEIRDKEQILLLLIQVVLAVVGFVRGWYWGVRLCQIVAFGFILAYLTVAPIYQLAKTRASWGDRSVLHDNPNRTTTALLLTIGFTACLLAGCTWGAKRTANREDTPQDLASPHVGRAWLMLLACAALTPGAIAAAGGINGLFTTRADRAAIAVREGVDLERSGGLAVALVSTLPGALAVAAALLFLRRVRLDTAERKGAGGIIGNHAFGLLLTIPLLVLHVNPFTASRFLLILAVGGIAVILLEPRGPRAARLLAGGILVGTLFVYPLLNFFRYGNVRAVATGWDTLASPDFDGFQQVINAVGYVEHHGHSWGQLLFSGIFFFIPRSVWPDKSIPGSVLVAEDRGYAFTNLSLPVNAELYIDFGALGMAAIAVGLGFLLARLDSAWLRQSGSRKVFVAPVIAFSMLGIIRGPIGAAAPIYLSLIGLCFLGLRRTARPASIETNA